MNLSKLKEWWPVLVAVVAIAGFLYTLPKRIEGVEAEVKQASKDNQDQFRILDRLTYVAEQNQQIQRQQMQQAPNAASQQSVQTFIEEDKHGRWVCVALMYEECWDRDLWRPVE